MPLQYERPSDGLLREFQAVARRAAAFEALLGQATNRPKDALPVLQLDEILLVLKALPNSTAEGGRQQLEMADSRLNEIRMEYFSLDDSDEDDDGFMREIPLDDSLSLLIAATRTALSAANREGGLRLGALRRRPSSEPDTADEEIAGALDSGHEAVSDLAEAQRVGRSLLDTKSAAGDRLLRRLNDASGLARQARVELQWKEAISAWIRKLALALARTPDLIRAAAGAIDTAADVAGPFYDQWKSYTDRLETLTREQLPIFTGNLKAAADRLEGRPSSERILLVEDEDSVRIYTARALQASGWKVRSAGSAKEALDLAARFRFDLLITDVVMPEKDGPALARELTRNQPRLPVLLVSGYGGDAIQRDVVDQGWKFLPKPYSIDELQSEVSAIFTREIKAKHRT